MRRVGGGFKLVAPVGGLWCLILYRLLVVVLMVLVVLVGAFSGEIRRSLANGQLAYSPFILAAKAPYYMATFIVRVAFDASSSPVSIARWL